MSAYWYENGEFYWLDDVETMRNDLQAYRQNVTLLIPGAEQALELFIAMRTRKAEEIVSVSVL